MPRPARLDLGADIPIGSREGGAEPRGPVACRARVLTDRFRTVFGITKRRPGASLPDATMIDLKQPAAATAVPRPVRRGVVTSPPSCESSSGASSAADSGFVQLLWEPGVLSSLCAFVSWTELFAALCTCRDARSAFERQRSRDAILRRFVPGYARGGDAGVGGVKERWKSSGVLKVPTMKSMIDGDSRPMQSVCCPGASGDRIEICPLVDPSQIRPWMLKSPPI